jgi:hypothetical protein
MLDTGRKRGGRKRGMREWRREGAGRKGQGGGRGC